MILVDPCCLYSWQVQSVSPSTSELNILPCEKFVCLLVLGHRVDNNILGKSDAITLVEFDRQEVVAKILLIEAIEPDDDDGLLSA